MVPSQWTMAHVFLIYSTTIDTGSGSFFRNAWTIQQTWIGFLVDLPQLGPSRLQSKVSVLPPYLTADTLAPSQACWILPYAKWQKHNCICSLPPLPYWMTSSTALTPLLTCFEITQQPSLRALSIMLKCFLFSTILELSKETLFFFFGGKREGVTTAWWKNRRKCLYYRILSASWMNIFMTRQWIIDIFKKWHFPPDNPSLGQDILVSQLPNRNSLWMK